MASIEVKGLSDEFVQRLEKQATANNRSLESEVLHILELATRQETCGKNDRFKERVQDIWQGMEPRAQTPAEDLIRLDRDGVDELGHGSI